MVNVVTGSSSELLSLLLLSLLLSSSSDRTIRVILDTVLRLVVRLGLALLCREGLESVARPLLALRREGLRDGLYRITAVVGLFRVVLERDIVRRAGMSLCNPFSIAIHQHFYGSEHGIRPS